MSTESSGARVDDARPPRYTTNRVRLFIMCFAGSVDAEFHRSLAVAVHAHTVHDLCLGFGRGQADRRAHLDNMISVIFPIYAARRLRHGNGVVRVQHTPRLL